MRQTLVRTAMLLMATFLGVASARAQEQPEWTARPLFSESGVYVLPRGRTAFEADLRSTRPATGPTVTDTAYRAEFGLPGRVQLGLHATGRTRGHEGAVGNIDAQALDVRWAFANWGRAWGNPAIQVGWTEASRGPDIGEVKLLLGGNLAGAWRWGSNVAWTQEASAARSIDRAWTAGISYAGSPFASVGVESRMALVDSLAADGVLRTPLGRELLAGPSLQIRPMTQLYIDVAALFGATATSSRSRATLVAGWQF